MILKIIRFFMSALRIAVNQRAEQYAYGEKIKPQQHNDDCTNRTVEHGKARRNAHVNAYAEADYMKTKDAKQASRQGVSKFDPLYGRKAIKRRQHRKRRRNCHKIDIPRIAKAR